MAKITYNHPDGSTYAVNANDPVSVMLAALVNNVPGIVGECGGNAMCATCHVYVRSDYLDRLPTMSDDEDEMLDGAAAQRTERSRLGCQIVIDDELDEIVVDLPPTQL
ncbi:2Fe-2S iron-sulfur cluster-binding protein [Cryptosporangium phraense]|uniref:2Fe-2S iron-sulfur cluster binding domain-containing protein n=1 Tax=Cryptosporangium phraense TaxID=2593070 RepID=A0A545AUW3_9ACTN|nr:2Fe-2S iron-sulfur cluster-binding protein [Cryptosporangium phraense]TQS45129.1 2Fe-2S iron-sulfur cluster binding domain-containing protein [Cryptosporangium phraense]